MGSANQVGKLAEYIMNEFPEEIKDGGAGDVAIEILKEYKAAKEEMASVIEIQGADGNWNYDNYMFGLYNGMEMMKAIVDRRAPVYKEAPTKWKKDYVNTEKRALS